MPFAELERQVDRALGRLPQPRAPETLLPRVLATVDAWVRRPWYTRAWFTWPRGLQAASAAAVALAAVVAWSLPGIAPVPESWTPALEGTRIVWRSLVQPVLPYVFVLVMLMCLACAAFGTALNYVFLERTADR